MWQALRLNLTSRIVKEALKKALKKEALKKRLGIQPMMAVGPDTH